MWLGALQEAQRHTGEHIGELSNEAWANAGLKNPVEDIFVRVSDNGTNMIKGWESRFQVRDLILRTNPKAIAR